MVSSLCQEDEREASEEQIAMAGEKWLLHVVSPCRESGRGTRQERTDQPNHKVCVQLPLAGPQLPINQAPLEIQDIITFSLNLVSPAISFFL